MDDVLMCDAHHVLADSSLGSSRIRVLKQGDTFAVFDQHGDILSSNGGKADCTTMARDFSHGSNWK